MIKNYDQIVSFDDVKQEAELIKLEADRAGRFITSCLAMKRARQRLAEKERTQQGHRGYHDESIKDIDPYICLLYTSPSPRDVEESRMPSSA